MAEQLLNRGANKRRRYNRRARIQWVAILINRGITDVDELRTNLEELGYAVSNNTIYNDMKALKARYRTVADQEYAEAQARLIEQHGMLYQEAVQAWDESKKPQVTITEKDGEQTIVTKYTAGHPQFLTVAENQLTRISKILGLERNQDWQQTLPDGLSPQDAIEKLTQILLDED